MKKLVAAVLVVVLSITLVMYIGENRVEAKENKDTKEIEETAEQAVTNILEAIRTVNVETLDKYGATILIGSTDEGNTQRNLKIFENLEYTILEVTETEGTTESGNKKDGTYKEGTEKEALAKIEIKNKDLTSIVKEYVDKSKSLNIENESLGEAKLSEAEMIKEHSNLLINLVDEAEYIEFKNTVDVKLVKIEGSWKIKPSTTLQNAIYGNIPKAQNDVDWGNKDISNKNMDETTKKIDEAINGKLRSSNIRQVYIAVIGEN